MHYECKLSQLARNLDSVISLDIKVYDTCVKFLLCNVDADGTETMMDVPVSRVLFNEWCAGELYKCVNTNYYGVLKLYPVNNNSPDKRISGGLAFSYAPADFSKSLVFTPTDEVVDELLRAAEI